MLVGFDAGHVEASQVAQRLGPGCDLCDGLGTRFEALGRCHEGGLLHGDPLDHGAAREDGRHRSQQRSPPPQRTRARGSEHLVRREDREVYIQRGQVESHVGARLAGVQQDERANRARSSRDGGDRGDGTRHIGDVCEGHKARIWRDDRQGVEVDAAVRGQVEPCQFSARARTQLLPGNDVRVVLGARTHDAVAGSHAQHLGLRAAHTCRRVAH